MVVFYIAILIYQKLNLESLRNEFAYVSQDASIFSASIYDNIVFSNPMASKRNGICSN